jgi:hypothetical protein
MSLAREQVVKITLGDQSETVADDSIIYTAIIAEESLGTPIRFKVGNCLKEAAFTQ